MSSIDDDDSCDRITSITEIERNEKNMVLTLTLKKKHSLPLIIVAVKELENTYSLSLYSILPHDK